MKSKEIRQQFIDHFKKYGHTFVPSSSVIPHEDPTLLFTNAGMNQFKPIFMGNEKRPYVRAVNSQKCIRVSGKHNDLEEVGRDGYHHTFFEMLGNWSFGDYYKKEAIEWAWELFTRTWGLPKDRLYATVYQDDDEAFDHWRKGTDIRPDHIMRFGEKDNFWEMGETGPCGPCSEIHIDLSKNGNEGKRINTGSPEIIELWNLVFIQYNREANGALKELPSKHVDTGAGFERICRVLQGKNSNYETDVFIPIIQKISETVNIEYRLENHIPFWVIADHIRMLTFAITDGAIPSNEGRGYVLRRILRRAARFGRQLNMHDPFIYKITGAVVDSMGDTFPEIKEKANQVALIIKGEEESFSETLDRGIEIFNNIVFNLGKTGKKVIPGGDVFRLYDTYGFPLDLTQLMAEEKDLQIDGEGFNEEMEKQRERGRSSSSFSGSLISWDGDLPNSVFVGYDKDRLKITTKILAANSMSGENYLILENTPFYAESGGQIGDTGRIYTEDGSFEVKVIDTQKLGEMIVHKFENVKGRIGDIQQRNKSVLAEIDGKRRERIMPNHTGTHLLHAALRDVLGKHVEQKGSYVGTDKLRFDFSHYQKLTDDDIQKIEIAVNEQIIKKVPVEKHVDIPFEQAKKMGALAFFGDKYGEKVRVIEIPGFSMEFCGGTHLENTSEIVYLKIISETTVASGIRRIEAVTGEGVAEYYLQRIQELEEVELEIKHTETGINQLTHDLNKDIRLEMKPFRKFGSGLQGPIARRSVGEIDRAFGELEKEFEFRLSELEKLTELKKSLEKEYTKIRQSRAFLNLDDIIKNATPVNGFRVVSSRVVVANGEELKSLADRVREKIGSGVGVLGAELEGKVSLVAVVTDDLIRSRNLKADDVVKEVAVLVGGGGGGKPHLATAGGKDISKLDDALRAVIEIVQKKIK